MTNLFIKIIRKSFWELGYEIRHKEGALKTYGNDPREVAYIRDLPYNLQNMPIELGVGLRFHSLTGRTYHPFILALRNQGLKNRAQEDFTFRVLKKYNELLSLKTANDFLGLHEEEKCFSNDSHPFEFTYPWNPSSPQDVKDFIKNTIRKENNKYDLCTDDSLDLANASDEKIRMETERLIDIDARIRREGYVSQSHDALGCFVLSHGENWRWYVQGGQHRAAVLAVSGHKTIPAYVRRVIRREDVCFWPNVQSGIFTEEKALMVFDRLFKVQPPPMAKQWVEYVDENFYLKEELRLQASNPFFKRHE